jgi:hypothetical protein
LGAAEYRDMTTEAIRAELEAWVFDLAELRETAEADPEAAPLAEAGIAFAAWRVAEIAKELARRHRLSARPGVPPWPNGPARRDRRDELEAIRRGIDLHWFCEAMLGVPLRRTGRQFVGPCPMPDHDDGSPSFTVDPERALWFCHGCRRGGDVFTLGAHWLGTTDFSAVVASFRGLTAGEAAPDA